MPCPRPDLTEAAAHRAFCGCDGHGGGLGADGRQRGSHHMTVVVVGDVHQRQQAARLFRDFVSLLKANKLPVLEEKDYDTFDYRQ